MHKINYTGKLVLADGSVYEGELLGRRDAVGEVVFTTGVVGYQEALTDPTFCGQVVVMTYPLIGNYGVNEMFNQGAKSYVQGLVVGELCEVPSNWRSEKTVAEFLNEQNVPTLVGVDTRAITRKLRKQGVMRGVIVPTGTAQAEIDALLAAPEAHDQVAQVTTQEIFTVGQGKNHVAVLDMGNKNYLLEHLAGLNCRCTVFPATATAEEILACNTAGVFLTDGPGNPKDAVEQIATVRELLGKKPIFAIGLGHQVLALAAGADTYKLKFGHRGSNQPVKRLANGRIDITSQNHGYAVDERSLEGKDAVITHLSMNDGCVEGVEYPEQKAFSVQYIPDLVAGEAGQEYLFKHFVELMEEC